MPGPSASIANPCRLKSSLPLTSPRRSAQPAGSPGAVCTLWAPQRDLHIAGIPGQFARGWEPAGPIAWPGPLFRSWVKAEAPALGPAHPIGPKVMGAKSRRGAAGRSSPQFWGRQHSCPVDSSCWCQLEGSGRGGRGDKQCVPGLAEGTAGQYWQKGHLCHRREERCGRPPGRVPAEAAFPGSAPGRTIPSRAAEGS